MAEPTEPQLERAVTALLPFVEAWDLPLNPEELQELAYAALASAEWDGPLEELIAVSEHRLAELAARQ